MHADVYQDLLKLETAGKTQNKGSGSGLKTLDNFGFKSQSKQASSKILDLATTLAVEGARPFSMFDDVAMRAITNFALLGAKEEGSVTGPKVRENLIGRARLQRERVKQVLKGKLLSISADLATCNSMSFFGMLVQYQIEGEINVINLACRQVYESHTAENIKKWLQAVQGEFDIDPRQILCISTDSAANIKKAAKDFIGELKSNFEVPLADDPEDDDLPNDVERLSEHYPAGIPFDLDPSNEINFSDDSEYQDDVASGINEKVKEPAVDFPNAFTINCVVHQLQLAIVKFLQSDSNKKLLAATRALAAKLRAPTIRNETKKESLKNAVIDQVTRWSSTSVMIESVLNLEAFCSEHQQFIKAKGTLITSSN